MKRGFKTLIAGVSIFVIGGFVLPFLWMLPLFQFDGAENQFIGPGEQEFKVETAGKYYLWNNFQTVHEGKSYSKNSVLPDGLEIAATTASGETLFFKTDTSISFTSGSSAKESIGYVEITSPTTVRIGIGGDFEPRVFSFGASMVLEFFKRLIIGIGTGALLAAIGIGVSVWGIVKLLRTPKVEVPTGET